MAYAVAVLVCLALLIFLRWRAARRREQERWRWFEESHAALIEQQEAQVVILKEIASYVIYLADHRSKKG